MADDNKPKGCLWDLVAFGDMDCSQSPIDIAYQSCAIDLLGAKEGIKYQYRYTPAVPQGIEIQLMQCAKKMIQSKTNGRRE